MEPQQQTIQWQTQKKIAQTLVMVQQYKLKTNFIGCNMTKKQFQFYYNFYRQKTHNRLNKILQKFFQIHEQLKKNIILCQFAELKALNNCIRNYRRRVNQLTFQPTKYSYVTFQNQQKQLQQILLKTHFEQSVLQQVKKIQQKVIQNTQSAQQSFESKKDIYDDKHRTPFSKITKVIDSTQAQCSRLYDNFQRSMMTISSQITNNLDKFSTYVSKWQHLASVRAYQVLSKKQEQIQAELNAKNNPANKTEQQQIFELTQALKRCTPYAPVRQQYQKRIEELRKIEIQKKMRQNRAGNLFNRKRNKRGILRQTPKYITIVDWHQTIDKDKKPIYPVQALWNLQDKTDEISDVNYNQGYNYRRSTLQQDKKNAKANRVTKEELLKSYVSANLNSKCWNDNTRVITFLMKSIYKMSDFAFQKNQVFQLCDTPLQILQSRIQFEQTVQVNLQEHDDRRKKQATQHEKQYEREDQRANNYHFNIGYKFLKQSQETDYFNRKEYCNEFLPLNQSKTQQNQKQFRSQEKEQKQIKQNSQMDNRALDIKCQAQLRQKYNSQKLQVHQNIHQIEFDIGQWIQFTDLNAQKDQIKNTKLDSNQINKQQNQQLYEDPRTQLERFTNFYFKILQCKIQRSFVCDPQRIPVKFVYFSSYIQIKKQAFLLYNQSPKLFIVCEDLLIFLQKFNAHQQISLLKVVTIRVGQKNIQQLGIQKLMKSFIKGSHMTFNHLSYEDIQEGSFLAFKIGIIQQFSKDKDEALEMKNQQILKIGEQIFEDYKQFWDQQQQPQQQGQQRDGDSNEAD